MKQIIGHPCELYGFDFSIRFSYHGIVFTSCIEDTIMNI